MASEGIESAEFDPEIPTPQVDFRSMIIEQSRKLEEENRRLQANAKATQAQKDALLKR